MIPKKQDSSSIRSAAILFWYVRAVACIHFSEDEKVPKECDFGKIWNCEYDDYKRMLGTFCLHRNHLYAMIIQKTRKCVIITVDSYGTNNFLKSQEKWDDLMVKGCSFFKEGKLSFVTEDYGMALFVDR